MEQPVFIWATALGCKERVDWLKANYNKPVTEDEYIEHIKSLPHDHPKAANCRNPSNNRRKYRNLKAKFGFFTDEARVK